MIPRIFIDADKIHNNIATIDGSDLNYLKNVMRLKVGDEIAVLDNKSREFASKIISMDKNSIKAQFLAEKQPKSELKIQVTIAQGLPKNPKMDIIVQKATELGAARVIPLMTERSVIKLRDKKEIQKKVERWRKIAKEAAEQSGRSVIPVIDDIKSFREIFLLCDNFDSCVMLWEMEKERTLKTFFRENKKIKNMLILIGPEGGFSHDEASLAKTQGFPTITIGNRILRTETAAPAVLSMINYEFEL
jgi:16S rRNA (uracil1498-N3)-methyltransferase